MIFFFLHKAAKTGSKFSSVKTPLVRKILKIRGARRKMIEMILMMMHYDLLFIRIVEILSCKRYVRCRHGASNRLIILRGLNASRIITIIIIIKTISN